MYTYADGQTAHILRYINGLTSGNGDEIEGQSGLSVGGHCRYLMRNNGVFMFVMVEWVILMASVS